MILYVCCKCSKIYTDIEKPCPYCGMKNNISDIKSEKQIMENLLSKTVICRKCLTEFPITNSFCPSCKEKRDVTNQHKH